MRSHSLASFLPPLVMLANIRERCMCKAELEVLDKVEFNPEISDDQMQPLIKAFVKEYEAYISTPLDRTVDEELDRQYDGGVSIINDLICYQNYRNAMSMAVEAQLLSVILGIWTAFEVLAGDLWEQALNCHPKILADLKGNQNRISGKKPNRKIKVREDARFSSLDGIRQAYSCAFPNSNAGTIDKILSSNALDTANLTRNLIVHKSAIVDAKYLDDCKSRGVKPLPAKLGKQIMVDGHLIVSQLDPVVKCAQDLLLAVDDWVTTH